MNLSIFKQTMTFVFFWITEDKQTRHYHKKLGVYCINKEYAELKTFVTGITLAPETNTA